MIQNRQQFDLTESTLGELRDLVAATAGMPDASEFRVRTRLGSNGDGSLVRRVSLSTREQKTL
jgi:hypothetical protein